MDIDDRDEQNMLFLWTIFTSSRQSFDHGTWLSVRSSGAEENSTYISQALRDSLALDQNHSRDGTTK